jgi:hypothetical protein
MSIKRAAYLILVIFQATACINLKEINHFSAEAIKGMQMYESMEFGFETQCRERCIWEAMDQFEIRRELLCDCSTHHLADSITLHLYNALHSYWDGLYQLSDNHLTRYDLSATSEAVQAGTFGEISISEEQVNAYQKIAELLFRAGTEGYRRRKIDRYLHEANDDIQVLSEKIAFVLESNLAGLLELEKERWYTYYRELGFSDNLSDYEKGRAIMAYYDVLREIDLKLSQTQILAASFRKMAEGHQILANADRKLSQKDLRDRARRYAAELKALSIAYNHIK